MAEITTQGQDRVAAVVARVERMAGPRGTYPKQVLPYLVKALDAAGLLLRDELRDRLVEYLRHAPITNEAVTAGWFTKAEDLLRELAGDGGSGVEVPTVITTAPRRMAANPGALIQPRHMTEHEESTWCQLAVPPCQPVAAAGDHKPGSCTLRASDALHAAGRCDALLRELAGEGGAPASEPVCSGCGAWAKDCFCTPTPAPRRMAANPLSAQMSRGLSLHATEHDEAPLCAVYPPCQPVAAVDPTPAHEHRWAPIAWEVVNLTATRVTRERCTRGDCTATREVGHG